MSAKLPETGASIAERVRRAVTPSANHATVRKTRAAHPCLLVTGLPTTTPAAVASSKSVGTAARASPSGRPEATTTVATGSSAYGAPTCHSARDDARSPARMSIRAFNSGIAPVAGGSNGDRSGSTCDTPEAMSPVPASAK
jgi:hypothetical protein